MDPVGVALQVVDIATLKRWNQVEPPDHSYYAVDVKKHDTSPFPYNPEINSKVILWMGDITLLNAHCIVNSTNESLNDSNPISERIVARAGPQLREEIRTVVKGCRTGEAKILKGYRLPARYIIHTVGPKYNIKYQTAAETTLYACYRKVLQIVREYRFSSVAFCVISSVKRGYPPDEGAHIAMRTVRRFLEKFGDTIETVIFAVESPDIGIYEMLMPLYFPRNWQEQDYALYHLPSDIGDENGEPIIPDRQIRIIDNPQHTYEDLEESVDIGAQLDSSVSIGYHAFSQMHEDIDRQRLLGEKPKTDPITATLTHEVQRKERYDRLLRRAKTEDLSEISGIGCLYQSGVDKLGRPVIVFIGKWLKFKEIDLDKALLYFIYLLDALVKGDYVIVYFHTLTSGEHNPPLSWIRDVYNILEYKYKKNLKAFYIVHPTFWTKLMIWWFTTFTAPAIKQKVHSLTGVEYLYKMIDTNQLEIPAFITEYDMTINGIRYYHPSFP